MRRVRRLGLGAALLVGAALLPGAGTARAQSPEVRADIDALLDALKQAPTDQMAALLEERLTRLWLQSGTAVTALLMNRGLRALNAAEYDDAIESFSDAITLQPGFAEAYYQRGVARYHAGNLTGAVADLAQTVKLEPRAFQAYRAMTEIAMARKDWKTAYLAWRRLLQIDPKTADAQERLNELKRKALGEDL